MAMAILETLKPLLQPMKPGLHFQIAVQQVYVKSNIEAFSSHKYFAIEFDFYVMTQAICNIQKY